MEHLSIESNLFEDSELLSAPLINANPRTVSARPTCVFITIGQEKCFKVFENRFCKGIGNSRLSEMLDEIRGTQVFKNLVQIISDVSGSHSDEIKKEFFFFGSRYNLKIIWEYCCLSKMDLEENPGILDDGDRMRLEDFKALNDFYLRNKTLKVRDDDTIMAIFSYFVNRDMILLASFMQQTEQQGEFNVASGREEEKENAMEMEIPPNMEFDFDILTEAEKFYLKYEGREPKNIWVEFATFESNSIDISTVDNLVFQKSKDFFSLEKRKGNSPKLFGLMYTEENAKINWTTRRLGDLPINLPRSFEELEQFKEGHLLECFRNLSKEAIDYETKALHFSAHMFYEKPEIKKQLYAMVNRFAFKNIKSSKKTAKTTYSTVKKSKRCFNH